MKIKILLLASNPRNTDTLRLAEEVREINESLKMAKYGEYYHFIQGNAVRVKDLRRLVLEHQPHFIHFSGHGTHTGLCLEDEHGHSHEISGDSLAGLFKHFDSVQAVILNACYSEAQAHAIAKVTPAVIGMNNPINDAAAIVFSTAFYDALAANKIPTAQDINTAFEIAKNAIAMMQQSTAAKRSFDIEGLDNTVTPQAAIPIFIKGDISREIPQELIKQGSESDDIKIGNSEGATLVATDNAVINYHGANPKKVKKLQKQLDLKDRTIERLLTTLDKNNTPSNKRTEAFEELARKYKNVQDRLKQYENPELEQQVQKLLEEGQLDKAEALLEQANSDDEKFIQQRQKAIAERTYSLAEISELKLDYSTALARYQKVTQLDPENLSAWQQLAGLSTKVGKTQTALSVWQQLQHYAEQQAQYRWQMIGVLGEADILAVHGSGTGALDKYKQAHRWFEEQITHDPNNSDWYHDLSVSYGRLGDMHTANGEGAQAIKAYKDSLKIAKTLAQRDPKNSDWQRDLSVSFNKLGDMHKANGEGAQAIKAYKNSHNIFETLAQCGLKNLGWQRDLSISFNKLGDMHQANGEGAQAIKAYENALTIRETLAQRDPKNADWQRDLSVSFNKLGDMHQANGEGAQAVEAYKDSHNIFETLAQRDPKNADWQRNLSVSFNKLGDMHKANGEGVQAIEAYKDSHNIFETLAQCDPKNSGWQRDLSVSFNKLGDMHKANGEGALAIKAYKDALMIRETLAQRNPNSSKLQRDLIVSYVKLSGVFPNKKQQYLQKALDIVIALKKSNRLYPIDHWMIDELKKMLGK